LSPDFVQEAFARYYRENAASILPPPSIESREFGFLLFDTKIMVRHQGFRNVEDLRSALKKTVPSNVFYSSAYYEKPKEDMQKKGWRGADLVFDIDADHITTRCSTGHSVWTCNCGAIGKGPVPTVCPTCGGQKINQKNWLCEVCLESAKTETIKLIDFLTEDFGFSAKELRVGFSGHRGYHVHVESEVIRALDAIARKEMVDYLIGLGLDIRLHGLVEPIGKKTQPFDGPGLSDPGWSGRIAKGIYGFLLTATPEELEKVGLKRNVVTVLMQNKEALLGSWSKKGPWSQITGIPPETWVKIAQQGMKAQVVNIDTVVTTDIHRLIRLSNTLHGKTGLKKMQVPIKEVEDFDPLKSAVSFREGTVSLFVYDAPPFRLGDQFYGPYKEEKLELPTAPALFLLCKGVAETVG
jgi:DNA primase small subunit